MTSIQMILKLENLLNIDSVLYLGWGPQDYSPFPRFPGNANAADP